MKAMPREMLLMIVRHGLTALGVWLVASGKLTEADGTAFAGAGTEIVGGVLTLLGLAWSAQRKVERAKRAKAAGGHPAKG